ncbi:MAG: hypothetical protein R3F46_16595, partial [bacterium]
LAVSVRDDNETYAHTTSPDRDLLAAPTDLRKVYIDPNLPGINDTGGAVYPAVTVDPEQGKLFGAYKHLHEGREVLRFLELDLESGSWQSTLMYDNPKEKRSLQFSNMGINAAGEMWATVLFNAKYNYPDSQYLLRRMADGSWVDAGMEISPGRNWSGVFDEQGFPVVWSFGGKDGNGVTPLWLHFRDESEASGWRKELVCSYAAYPRFFQQQDGSIQILTTRDLSSVVDGPRFLMNRDPQGNWNEIMQGNWYGNNLWGNQPLADSPIAWSALLLENGQWKLLVNGTQGIRSLPANAEYELIRKLEALHHVSYYLVAPAAAGDSYHLLPFWLRRDGQMLELSYDGANQVERFSPEPTLQSWDYKAASILLDRAYEDFHHGTPALIDPQSGHAVFFGTEPDQASGSYRLFMLTTYGTEARMYDPLDWPEWTPQQ